MTWLITFIALSTTFRDYDVKLIDCYDGDTCDFDIYLGMDVVIKKQTVRLCDINAPEIKPPTRKRATKIKEHVEYLIKRANIVKLRISQKRNCEFIGCDKKGKYGRWLGYIIIDGANLNQALLDNDLVQEWKEKCI